MIEKLHFSCICPYSLLTNAMHARNISKNRCYNKTNALQTYAFHLLVSSSPVQYSFLGLLYLIGLIDLSRFVGLRRPDALTDGK